MKKRFVSFLLFLYLFVPQITHAQDVYDMIADVDSLGEVADMLQKIIIGIGVFASVFILPIIFIKMGSGDPNKIKEGREWLISLASGLVLLILAGTIVRVVGKSILGF